MAVMVDLSHTSDDTARQALSVSRAPAFFSHSGARAIYNHTRNLPDDILESIAEGSGRDSFV
jgi:membrane dipeptidase